MNRLRVNMVSESVYGFEGQGVHTAFLNFSAMLRAQPGVEVLVNSREDCDVLHAHTLGPLYWTLRHRYPGRRVMSAHVVPASLEGSLVGWKLWGGLFSRYMVAAYNSAESVLPVAPAVMHALKGLGVRSSMSVVSNPVDLGRFRPDPELRARGLAYLGLPRGAKVALCVGQIQPRKGVDDFLEAARRNPGWHFVWAGGRPFSLLTEGYFDLAAKIKAAGPRVHFKGVLDLGQMPELYNASDVLFFPSRQETFGLAIAEAAACGLPLILRPLADYQGIFDQAFLAADGPGEFDAALRLLSRPAARRPWKARAIRKAADFSAASLASRLLERYRALPGLAIPPLKIRANHRNLDAPAPL